MIKKIKASDLDPDKSQRARGEKNPLGRIPEFKPQVLLQQMQQNNGAIVLSEKQMASIVRKHVAERMPGVELSEAKRNGVTDDLLFDVMSSRAIIGVNQAAHSAGLIANGRKSIYTSRKGIGDDGTQALILSLHPLNISVSV